MKYKYLILDFGNVLVTPTTGDWDMTPKFLELLDINKIDQDIYKEARKKYSHILSEHITTLDEEYNMFLRFYDSILTEIKYPKYNKKIAEKIAYDRTYKNDKYQICNNVFDELTILKDKYRLLLLTDNWPCVIPYLKDYNLYDFFEKIYVSSVYGVEKKDKVFFDYPIKDFNIKPNEALFIDDNELNLDIAKEKGFDVLLMDRSKKIDKSKYKIINDLLLGWITWKFIW